MLSKKVKNREEYINELTDYSKLQDKKIENREEYINELTDYSKLQDKKIVSIDLNQSDLLYCVDEDTK
jgi:hypothetical protein